MMQEDETSARNSIAELMSQHLGRRITASALELITAGASGRVILRGENLIGIYWTDARADNNSFLPAAKGLKAAHIRVPSVLAEHKIDSHSSCCLVEDLGSRDLLQFKSASWEEKRHAYQQAFETLIPFYHLQVDWELQAPFDFELYRWEQNYFAEHFLGTHLGKHNLATTLMAEPAFKKLAHELAAKERIPVHRDCQSQNMMLAHGHAWLIDFQGMRMGLHEYDLASLIFDPYMNLSATEQGQLLALWHDLGGRVIHQDMLYACGLQRLMQALGAFANIAHNAGKAWYFDKIPAGLTQLLRLARHCPRHTPAYHVSQCLIQYLGS